DDVVVAERLFDHHEVKLVQPLEVVGVGKCICGVGICHQLDRWKSLAHATNDVDVPARLDLHLDALIACRKLSLDLFEKLFDGILDADRDAAWDLSSRSAINLLP